MILTCLATVIYLEARGESAAGQRAVADVVLTRAAVAEQSVCDVAAAPAQFAYQPTLRPREPKAWAMAVSVAMRALSDGPDLRGATHFHEVGVRPAWTKGAVFMGRVGDHLFWRVAE